MDKNFGNKGETERSVKGKQPKRAMRNSENRGSFSNLDNGLSPARVLRQEYIGCNNQVQWHCLGEKIYILEATAKLPNQCASSTKALRSQTQGKLLRA